MALIHTLLQSAQTIFSVLEKAPPCWMIGTAES